MSDIYGAPAARGVAVTPSDTTVVNCRMVYIGGAGNLVVEHFDGGPKTTYTAITPGIVHMISAYRIAAATTATAIVALY